jgi:hypothetical protein
LTSQRFIELYARACMRIAAVRLARTTLRSINAIVPCIEDAMFDGLTLRQIEVRMIYGLL